ncbi:MAG: hypothetical protein KAI28_12430 [Sphingomonadales bacterium]|nr:hypothetical protein [Sphingomonadales bacterium]
MLNKRTTLTALSGFLFLNLYGFYIHGHHLADTYALMPESTYRPESQFMEMFGWVTGAYALMAIAMVAIKKDTWGCPKDGLKFGLWMGLFMGSVNMINYAVYPWPFELAYSAFAADVFMGAFTGLIMAIVNNKLA